jgi:hypothetical protein
MDNDHNDDAPQTAADQAAHFVAGCSKCNTKLLTIRRADLKRALGSHEGRAAPQNDLTAYLNAKAMEAESKYVSVVRGKLLAGCQAIVDHHAAIAAKTDTILETEEDTVLEDVAAEPQPQVTDGTDAEPATEPA